MRMCFNTCSSCEEQRPLASAAALEPVSIHAPLARSNIPGGNSERCSWFQYMLLLRGATDQRGTAQASLPFQYMLLLRGATKANAVLGLYARFNTCSSCEEQLAYCGLKRLYRRFNTCSSCEEQHKVGVGAIGFNSFQYMLLLRGATQKGKVLCLKVWFQYMLLLRGATFPSLLCRFHIQVSIHAPLARSNFIRYIN